MPKRVLVIVTQQIGDVLHCAPLVSAVRLRWPRAVVDVLGFAGTLGMLRGHPDVNELIEVERRRDRRSVVETLRRLWRRYDVALVTQCGDRAQMYGWIAAGERSVLVPRSGNGSWWKRRLADHTVMIARDDHSVLQKLRLLAPWLDIASLRVVVAPPAPAPLPPDIAALLRSPCVVVHAPSMWRYKQWPVASYRAVVQALLGDGVQVVLTGSASEHDQSLIAALRAAGSPPQLLDASGRIGFAELATLLEHADAYLGPDTSITHLAAAVGTPMVALFGPTRPTNWGPWPTGHPAVQPWRVRGAEPHRVQRLDAQPAAGRGFNRIVLMQGPSLPGSDCVPCGRAGCEDHRQSRSHCLESLGPQGVLDELRALLAAASRHRLSLSR